MTRMIQGPIQMTADQMREAHDCGKLPEGIFPPLRPGVDFRVNNPGFDENGLPDDAARLGAEGIFYKGGV